MLSREKTIIVRRRTTVSRISRGHILISRDPARTSLATSSRTPRKIRWRAQDSVFEYDYLVIEGNDKKVKIALPFLHEIVSRLLISVEQRPFA